MFTTATGCRSLISMVKSGGKAPPNLQFLDPGILFQLFSDMLADPTSAASRRASPRTGLRSRRVNAAAIVLTSIRSSLKNVASAKMLVRSVPRVQPRVSRKKRCRPAADLRGCAETGSVCAAFAPASSGCFPLRPYFFWCMSRMDHHFRFQPGLADYFH
jgi:hypothetical protein